MTRRSLLQTLLIHGAMVATILATGCAGDRLRLDVRDAATHRPVEDLYLRIDTSTAGALGWSSEEQYAPGPAGPVDKQGGRTFMLYTYATACRVTLQTVPLEYDPPYFRQADLAVWRVSLADKDFGVWQSDPLNRYQLRIARASDSSPLTPGSAP